MNDRLRRLWSLRRSYARSGDWLASIYQRVLIHFPRLPLPLRERLRKVRLAGIPEPFYVRLGTTDWYVLEEVFIDGVYDAVFTRAPARSISNVLDLGANAGFSARLWRSKFPQAFIVAVEPDTENLEMCRLNLSGETFNKRLRLVQACVSGEAGQVALDRTGGSWRFSMREARATDEEVIEARTLPQIVAACEMKGTIDLIKCNIEGAEAEVFSDCAAWIGSVRLLAVQVHSPYTTERFMEDLRRGGGRFNLYHMMDCEAGSKMLFLEQSL